jgi:predicted nucleic acid-binding protein
MAEGRPVSLDALIGKILYLDTNIFIFAVEGGNPWASLLRDLFGAIEQRVVRALTSELTLAEVLAKPFALGAASLVSKYDQLLAEKGSIEVVPISRQILRTSAELQAELEVKLADAIHLATAKHTTCDILLTNDEKLGRKMPAHLKWLSLTNLAAT